MEIRVEAKKLAEVDSDALVIVGFEGAPPDTPAADQTKELYDSGEFSGKALEIAILHRPGGLKAKRLVLAGGGKRDKFDAAELRKLAGAVVRALKAKGVHTIALALEDAWRSGDFAAAAVEGAVLADLENDRYKTDPKKNEKTGRVVFGAGGLASSRGSRAHSGGSAKFHPRSCQRTRQRLDSHSAGRARDANGSRIRPGVRGFGSGPHAPAWHGRAAGRRARQRRASRADRHSIPARQRTGDQGSSRPGRQGRHLRHRRHLHQARRGHGKDALRHGRRRGGAGRHARHRADQAVRSP